MCSYYVFFATVILSIFLGVVCVSHGFRTVGGILLAYVILSALAFGFEPIRRVIEEVYISLLLKGARSRMGLLARFCLHDLLTIGHRGIRHVGKIILNPSNQDWGVREIAKHLRKSPPTLRIYLLHSLSDQGVPFEILLRMVPSEDWESRAYLHLLSMGNPWNLSVLRRALSHDEAIVRRLAAKHLSLIETTQVKEEEIKLLHRIAQYDPDPEVRHYALTATIRWESGDKE